MTAGRVPTHTPRMKSRKFAVFVAALTVGATLGTAQAPAFAENPDGGSVEKQSITVPADAPMWVEKAITTGRTVSTVRDGENIIELRTAATLPASRNGWSKRTRFHSYGATRYTYYLWRTVNGTRTLAGASHFTVKSVGGSSLYWADWGHETRFQYNSSWGEVSDVRITTFFACTLNCEKGRGNSSFRLGPASPRHTDTGVFSFNQRDGSEGAIGTTFRFSVVRRVGMVPTWSRVMGDPGVRCDKKSYLSNYGKCRISAVVPVFRLSLSGRYPKSALHIKQAQTRFGARTLSRYYWGRSRNLNRSKAMSVCRKLPKAGSCDEYPFASTYQGCSIMPPCSVKKIPLADNVGSGRALGRFYLRARVVHGDRFRVKISR